LWWKGCFRKGWHYSSGVFCTNQSCQFERQSNNHHATNHQIILIKDIPEPCLKTGFFIYFVNRLLCMYLTSLRRSVHRSVFMASVVERSETPVNIGTL